MKKMNKKGYTLIELLAIILILGLVTSITITVILSVLSNAKAKSDELTKRNIRDQAEKYIYEGFSDNNWKKVNSVVNPDATKLEYKCVKIQDLIDIGYYKQSIIEENSDLLSATDIVKITRNRETKAIVSKEITNNTDCDSDTEISVIQCEYNKDWAKEKDIKITFQNSEDYNKRVFLNNITNYTIGSGFLEPKQNDYYNINNNEAHVRVRENGLIIADTIKNGYQMTSVYCNVMKIDTIPPKVKLKVVDGNNLVCTMQDNESGLKSYKICRTDDADCNYTNLNLGENEVNNEIVKTMDDVENGYWYCDARDRAGNVGTSANQVLHSVNVSVSAQLVANELNSNDLGAQHSGESWTNKSVRLTGTIKTNVDTFYTISDKPLSEITNWTSYTGTGSEETINVSQDIIQTTNKTYYLYVKYKKGSTMENLNPAPSAKVKVDKTPPTCTLSIPLNNNASGISVTTTCNDAHSGCTSDSSGTHTGVTSNTTYTVSDNVGNTNSCSVTVTKKGFRKYCDESYGDPSVVGSETDSGLGTYRVGCHVVLNESKFDDMEICGKKSNSDTFCIKKSTTPTLSKLKTKLEDLNPPAGTPRTSTYYIDIKEETVRKDYIKKEKGLGFCTAYVKTKYAKNGFWKKVSEISVIDYNKSRSQIIPYVSSANTSSKAKIKFHTYSCRYKDVVSNDSCSDNPGFKYDASKDIGYTCSKVYHGTV